MSSARSDVAAEDARDRIMDAAVALAARSGDVAMHTVALRAGVSKGLIHYHFASKATLVAAAIERATERVVTRERQALAGVTASGALDAHWRWLASERERGELRGLLALQLDDASEVRSAAEQSLDRRRRSSSESASRILALMAARPRVPVALLGDLGAALVAGLVVDATRSERELRAAFDVHWLAILALDE